MFSRKQIKIISSLFVLILSIVIIATSGSSSNLSSAFKTNSGKTEASISQPPTQDQTAEANSDENSPLTQEGQQSYQVVKVVDGDTVDVDIDGQTTRLRIIGIDTPETVDPRKPVQCFGNAASDKAKEILSSQFVTLVADVTQGDKDKYGRSLRYVYLPDGTDYGLYMISQGYAHEYTYDIPYQHQTAYKQAEVDARNANMGLWSPSTCNGNK